jgi:hypothetical protein
MILQSNMGLHFSDDVDIDLRNVYCHDVIARSENTAL